MDFKVFCLLESRLKYGQIVRIGSCDQIEGDRDYKKMVLMRCVKILDNLFLTVFQPLYEELNFDEVESTAVKTIAMYSSAVELSDDGMKKAAFARDVFTLKLMEHIEYAHPELTRQQQLIRLSKLMDVIKTVKNASRFWAASMTEAVLKKHCGLHGRITYDFYLNGKE